MSAAQCQQLYELWKKAALIMGKKTPERAKTDNGSDESLFANVQPRATNRNNPALDRAMQILDNYGC